MVLVGEQKTVLLKEYRLIEVTVCIISRFHRQVRTTILFCNSEIKIGGNVRNFPMINSLAKCNIENLVDIVSYLVHLFFFSQTESRISHQIINNKVVKLQPYCSGYNANNQISCDKSLVFLLVTLIVSSYNKKNYKTSIILISIPSSALF